MSFCPKCNAVIDANDVECPQCHYDFNPNIDDADERNTTTTLKDLLVSHASKGKAMCPSCDSEIAIDATKCKECGYDFNPSKGLEGFAYSQAAQTILFIAFVIYVIGFAGVFLFGTYVSLFSLYESLMNTVNGSHTEWIKTLSFVFIFFPMSILLGMAQLIIITRVMDIQKK